MGYKLKVPSKCVDMRMVLAFIFYPFVIEAFLYLLVLVSIMFKFRSVIINRLFY